MRRLCPTATAYHYREKIFIHKELATCSHVLIRVDRVENLANPYEGPFRINSSLLNRVFSVDVNGRKANVSIEQLKPAFFEAPFHLEPGQQS